MLDIFK
jgi:pSer/pThr/pTyr-binding forkhead associated (FHA) protein